MAIIFMLRKSWNYYCNIGYNMDSSPAKLKQKQKQNPAVINT